MRCLASLDDIDCNIYQKTAFFCYLLNKNTSTLYCRLKVPDDIFSKDNASLKQAKSMILSSKMSVYDTRF